jgi:CHAT domain-containing protein
MPLDCDLASLSGCSTAGGYVVAGEGTLGLTRSFLKAGARSVVATRWDVEDAAARRFMEAFYAALREGHPRDHAMQQARAELAAEGAGHRERSAFMLVGVAAEPVTALQSPDSDQGMRDLVWIAGIFTVLLLLVIFRRPR